MEVTLISVFLELGWKYIINDITMELKTWIKIDTQKCTYFGVRLFRANRMSLHSWQIKSRSCVTTFFVDWVEKQFITLISHLWIYNLQVRKTELRKSHATKQCTSLKLACLYTEICYGIGWLLGENGVASQLCRNAHLSTGKHALLDDYILHV